MKWKISLNNVNTPWVTSLNYTMHGKESSNCHHMHALDSIYLWRMVPIDFTSFESAFTCTSFKSAFIGAMQSFLSKESTFSFLHFTLRLKLCNEFCVIAFHYTVDKHDVRLQRTFATLMQNNISSLSLPFVSLALLLFFFLSHISCVRFLSLDYYNNNKTNNISTVIFVTNIMIIIHLK